MRNFVFCLLACGSLLPLSAQARPYHLTSVRWIVETRNKITYDDRYVTMIGHVTRRIGDEEYWFTDGTGSVRLDSENFDLPVGRRLMIGGRIDQAYLGFGHLEVDVRKWSYAPLRRTTPPSAVAHPTPAPATAPALKPAVEAAPAPAVQTSTAPAPTVETSKPPAPAVETSTPPAPAVETAPAPAPAVDTNTAPSGPVPPPATTETTPAPAANTAATNDIPSFTPPPTNAVSPLTPPADTH